MDAIKKISLILLFIPFLLFGQKNIYPKDTIYIKFEDTIFDNPNMKAKSFHTFNNKKGIKFWWKEKWLFHKNEKKIDTLCFIHIKNFKLSSLKEIENKERKYYKKRFGRIPWIKNKNGVFHTFLIEILSKDKFVIYPVIWMNEGVID